MKKVLIFISLFLIVVSCTGKGPSLKLDKKVYNPGETITVEFKALEDYDNNAWIGIIPSEVTHGSEAENDRYDLTYRYIYKKTSGTMTFTAPLKPGSYDIRMHDSDSNGKEVASVTFKVVE